MPGRPLAQLTYGKDRLRGAVKILASEPVLDLDGDDILGEKEEPPVAVMKLMAPDGSDEFDLFPGENAIGRGCGNVKFPTVSRKQMVLTIDADTGKAFVKSCRDEKGNSVPGVKRGDNPWRVLTSKGQTLSQGDRIAMQFKKDKVSGVQLQDEYVYVPLDSKVEKPTIWQTLFGQGTGPEAA